MGRNLRVLFVNPGRDLGGAEQCLLSLLPALGARGVDGTVALFGDGPFAARLSSLRVPVGHVNVPRAVQRVSRYEVSRSLADAAWLTVQALPSVVGLAALARRTGADLLHTNGLKAHLLGGLAGRLVRRPVVWHMRDFPPGGFAGTVFRAGSSLPSLVIAVSEAVAAQIRSEAPRAARVVPLHDPIDLDRFRADLSRGRIRAEVGLSDDTLLVGMVAHLTPWKGHDTFLRVARAVADEVPNARFLLVGGPIYDTGGHEGYPEMLNRLTVELGLVNQVTFLGVRDDVPDILTALDVLVHCPSSPEPFGRVLVEAMAVARPVVATGAGGIPEIVEHGVTGLLVAPGDVAGFALGVKRLLKDSVERRRLGEAGRRRAEARFSIAPHADRVLQAYRSIT